ncbi:hypothetical protein HMPREF1624_04960 [Sporothrix schenckii ATCC 58251]|uniref:mannan endo-1,6-alpha-mannosidase n=1 Tax=Sporothrix schenckii (strain ATCC 58251 / de Perez 2211183) TaxID=1391915 RepID=U7PTU1_SPOS1|nr:hypothetical protein HMPREF1624_04960 [Sporothrix schenckii ATCC 58251]
MAALRGSQGHGRLHRSLGALATSALLLFSTTAAAYNLDTSSTDSIKSVANSMAEDMLSFYDGNKPGGTPGLLPQPYYWWEAGAMLGSLVDYWYYTGDTRYNELITDGLLFQVGPNNDYMPPNQTLTEGNDDQGFWGLSVMTAAEYKFPDPPKGKPGWLALAQAVFNTQAARWEDADCAGGLRWQIFNWNNGYDYKNSISQACFFNLAARLFLYTGNATYGEWAVKTYDWMRHIKFMDEHYNIFDGAHIESACTDLTPYQWSYNVGNFLLGSAAMYNYSALQNDSNNEALWKERVDGLLNASAVFFTTNDRNIMTEVACEPVNLCDLDQQSFKAYLSRWMAATTKWAPWTSTTIMPLLNASAIAAAQQCTGGDNGRMCGLRWTDNGTWDGSTGVGQQMAAMEVTLANMIKSVTDPVTNSTGGTSVGDPNAGGSDIGRTQPQSTLKNINTGDRVGAGILTALVLAGIVAGVIYMLVDETVDATPKERLGGFVTAVNKNGKRLAKRNFGSDHGDGLGGVMSEKGKQPRVQSFRVLDRSNGDRSSGSDMVGAEGFFAGRQHNAQHTGEVSDNPVTGPVDPEKAVGFDSGGAPSNTPAHHSFFSPAYFRKHNAGTSGNNAGNNVARQGRLSQPGRANVVQHPSPATPLPGAGAAAPVETNAEATAVRFQPTRNKKRNYIKRKLLQSNQ